MQYFFVFILDIISIEDKPAAKKNILLEFNRLYENLTKCRKKSFVKSSIEKKRGDKKLFQVNFTLLPHQTLIFPESYLKKLNTELLNNYKLFNNNEIR